MTLFIHTASLLWSSCPPSVCQTSPSTLLQLPHVRLCGVDLTPPCLLTPRSPLPVFLLLVVFVLLGLALPQRDERRVKLIQRDGCGVLHVLLQ